MIKTVDPHGHSSGMSSESNSSPHDMHLVNHISFSLVFRLPLPLDTFGIPTACIPFRAVDRRSVFRDRESSNPTYQVDSAAAACGSLILHALQFEPEVRRNLPFRSVPLCNDSVLEFSQQLVLFAA